MKTLIKMLASPFELAATDTWDLAGFLMIIALVVTLLSF